MGFPRPWLGGRVMRCLGAACAPALLAAALLCSAPEASAAIPAWTTYHHDGARSGIDPDSTTPLPPARLWQTGALDGSVWGEPLLYGSTVYVATENDTIYALDAGTGAVHWEAHLGTPVPSSELECGDISPTVGITSTPVIDPVTNTIYAVTDAWDGSDPASIHHYLVALDLSTGAMRPNFPLAVDPPFPAGGDAAHQLQRAGLALDNGEVVIGYGGNDGDCGTYWGWLVAAPESGSGPEYHFQVEEAGGHHGGAIWGSGNAPAVDGAGYLYAATGNGYSGGHFDDSESVLRLEADMRLVEVWAPANWLELDEGDGDLGSSNPVVLPNGLVFQIGKSGEAGPAAPRRLRRGRRHPGGLDPGVRLLGRRHLRPGELHERHALHHVPRQRAARDRGQRTEMHASPNSSSSANSLAGVLLGEAIGPPIYAGGLIWVHPLEQHRRRRRRRALRHRPADGRSEGAGSTRRLRALRDARRRWRAPVRGEQRPRDGPRHRRPAGADTHVDRPDRLRRHGKGQAGDVDGSGLAGAGRR